MRWKDKARGLNNNCDTALSIGHINNAIEFIEQNLENKIELDAVAQKAFCSSHHFQRIFSFIMGISLSDYIRQRRLTKAVCEIRDNQLKVIDVALKFGYDSPSSFSRAFKAFHGISPTEAKNNGVTLVSFPKLIFNISIKGEMKLNYRIEEKSTFEVFGIEKDISTVDRQDFKEVPQFWAESRANGNIRRIQKAAGVCIDTPIHAALYNCTDIGYNYLLCLPAPKNGVSSDFTKLIIPKSTWAIFPAKELSQVETARESAKLWNVIFTEWFPTSGYELASVPEMEMHYRTGKDKFLAEIWIPVNRL